MKTLNAQRVLQLMDKDYSYCEAIKIVVSENNILQSQLEVELESFI